MSKNVFRIFYAWQNDLPEHSNKAAIRKVLRALRTPLEQEFSNLSLDVEIDEATRGEPGSPNIPQTILAKISKSQVFVGDVSLVNQGVATDPKKTPNPNVLFELGYAVATLGWARMILPFNKTFGDLKELPFDIDRQRVSPYRLKQPADDASHLRSLCFEALKTIISRNPSRPDAVDAATLKRKRDLKSMEFLLQAIYWPSLELHLRNAPKRISRDILIFWEHFKEIRDLPTFHLYDKKLLKLIDVFKKHWHQTTKFGERYEADRHSNYYIFTYSQHASQRKREETDFVYIENELIKLNTSMRRLLQYVREEYIELDLGALSEAAWNKYQEGVKKD
jgi:hypothetical protein